MFNLFVTPKQGTGNLVLTMCVSAIKSTAKISRSQNEYQREPLAKITNVSNAM